MSIENLRKWLKGEYVSPPVFKESLIHIINDYERLIDKENNIDYKSMAKSFIGETIQDFFCNGFFGSRTYDLMGAEITKIYEDDGIVIEVKKVDDKYDYGYFNDGWKDWECVYNHLNKWVNEQQDT